MINQKQLVIPKVGAIDITNYTAVDNFTSNFIEFSDSYKDWSIDITVDNSANVPATDFTINNIGANLTDGTFTNVELEGGGIIDVTVAGNIVTVVSFVSGGSGYTTGDTVLAVTPFAGTIPTQPTFDVVADFLTASTLTISVCNVQDGVYKTYKTASLIDLSDIDNCAIYDINMPIRFMKLDYISNNSTGEITINIIK